MADRPDRVERVLDLLMMLLETRVALTREEIFERLRPIHAYPESADAARRAFERDKETLRDLGVPIHTEPVGDGSLTGYRVKPSEYYLPDPGLDESETIALRVALNAVTLGDSAGTGALLKLGSEAGSIITPLAALVDAPALPELFEAVRIRAVAGFVHRGTVRRLEPYGIAVRRGHWYVVGRDLDREAMRAFRVDRIDDDVTVGPAGTFERPVDFVAGDHIEDRAWMLDGRFEVTVRIRIDTPSVPVVLGDLGDDAVVVEEGETGIEVEVTVTRPGALRNHLLGYLDAVEILGPPEERDAMVAALRVIEATA